MKLSINLRVVLTALLTLGLTSSLFAQEEGWGHLTGSIVVEGDLPEPDVLDVDHDEGTCAADGAIRDRSLIVGEEGQLQGAFVMMYLKSGEPVPEVHESYLATAEDKVVLDNNKCMFVPNTLFLRTSQTLVMKNSDPVGHNCHITLFDEENEHNVLIPGNTEVEVRCPNPEKSPGPVKCDIHKWMKATILVRDEPYVAVTDADGNFTIENLPAGKWTFQFWHSRSGFMRSLASESIEDFKLGRRGEAEFTIESGKTLDLGKLVISAEKLDD